MLYSFLECINYVFIRCPISCYLHSHGAIISVENSVKKDILARINNANNSCCSLRNMWKSNVYRLKTKLWLFTATSYQYYYMDAKSGESRRMICTSWMYFKPNVNGGSAIYYGKIRYPMRFCLENDTISHTKRSTEMDTHMKRIKEWSPDYTEKIDYSRMSDMGLTMGEAQVIAQNRKGGQLTLCLYATSGMKMIGKFDIPLS